MKSNEEIWAIQMYQAKIEAEEYCEYRNIPMTEIQEEENGYRVRNRLFRI